MLINSYYPIENINNPIQNIIFEIDKDPHETQLLKMLRTNPFEETGIKDELDHIPQFFMKI